MLVWGVLGYSGPHHLLSSAEAPGAFSRGSRAGGCVLEGVLARPRLGVP